MKKIIALDLGGTALKAALVDESGKIAEKRDVSTKGKNKDEMLGIIVETIHELKKIDAGVIGVGLGMPGPLDPFMGVVLVTPNLPFKEPFPIKEHLEKETGLSVVVNNDANCAALGEAWLGAGTGAQNVVMLTLGTGIGGGLVLDGKLYMGSNGLGAELGHVTIADGGRACGCGSKGCFEALANAGAIVDAAQEIDPNITDSKEVAELAKQGNEQAQAIWNQEGRWLGVAIANYINIFNPDFVIIGGAMSGAWEFFEKSMGEEVRSRAFPMILQHAQIVQAQLGNDAGILGAARLVIGG